MTTRRAFLAGSVAAGLSACGPTRPPSTVRAPAAAHDARGGMAGRPMPALGPTGVVHDGRALGAFGIDPAIRHPDVLSHRTKLGLLVPATNTSAEAELWRIIADNRDALDGVGIHTTPVVTPRPVLRTEEDLNEYRRQFVAGLGAAIDHALLAEPDRLVMGMSLEHVLYGLEPIRAVAEEARRRSRTPWATWHDAAPRALNAVGAKRIGLLTPFDEIGNRNASRMFEELGFEVVSTVGFACANALDIAHVPNAAKERAIMELLATPANRLDAIVQCGTNMSLVPVTEKLEPVVGIPILGINAVTFWHALRDNGIHAQLARAGRLLREH